MRSRIASCADARDKSPQGLLSLWPRAYEPPSPKYCKQAAQKVVLVELFTSEGCSSCPPADALLRQVNGAETTEGQLIVGISEHVTYWNAQGWSDPFSSPVYTQRQNDYVDRFHLESSYTPQMVVNGAEQFVGSDRAAFVQAVRKSSNSSRRSPSAFFR